MRRLRAAHDVDRVAPQARLDDVLAVDGEVVAHEHAAARAERQPFDVIGLRAVGRHAIGADGRRDVGVAHRGARDFPGGAQVAIHQRRIGAEHVGDVVEAVRLAVVRQECVGVDLEREQIADRVAVLGAVQAVQRFAAGVRVGGGGRVELIFEISDELGGRLFVRQRLAGRRHHAAAQFLDDGFPDLGVRADVGERHALERQIARALGLVVAVGAVAVDDVFRRGRALFDAGLASREREGADGDGEGSGKGEGGGTHNPKKLREKSSQR